MTSECQTSTIKESTIRMLQTGNILNSILCRHTLIFKYILKYISEMCPLHLSHRKWVVDSWCGTFWKSSFCSRLGFSVNIFDVLRSRNSCIAHVVFTTNYNIYANIDFVPISSVKGKYKSFVGNSGSGSSFKQLLSVVYIRVECYNLHGQHEVNPNPCVVPKIPLQ